MIGDVGKVLWVLMGSIVMVLLVACANVANLLLVRVEGRRQELAIRSALGAPWGRTAADLLFESVVLGVAGAGIGLGLAFGALRVLVAMAPTGLPRIHEIGIDIPVLAFHRGRSRCLRACSSGPSQLLKFAGASAASGLREGGRALSQSRERHRARKTLVIVQVGLALVLLICSGLMIRTFRALMHVSPGFVAPESVEQFRFYIPETQIPDSQAERVVRMDEAILNKIGSDSRCIVGQLLQRRAHGRTRFERHPLRARPCVWARASCRRFAASNSSLPDSFPRLARGSSPAAILLGPTPIRSVRSPSSPRTFAREYWHDAEDALGKKIRVASTDDWREIVGVAQDVHDDGVDKPAPSAVYWPVMRDNFEGQKQTCSVASLSLSAVRAPVRRPS